MTARDARQERAIVVLQQMGLNVQHAEYLGKGFAGVVYRIDDKVFKVHIPKQKCAQEHIDSLLFIAAKQHILAKGRHFYAVQLDNIDGVFVLSYPYEEGEIPKSISLEEYIDFLTECWLLKLLPHNISPNNLKRVGDIVKLIDYELQPFDANRYINLAIRAYLVSRYSNTIPHHTFLRLKRSAINNRYLLDKEEFTNFLSKLFSNISFVSMSAFIDQLNLHSFRSPSYLSSHGYLQRKHSTRCFVDRIATGKIALSGCRISPQTLDYYTVATRKMPEATVSLIIKACSQDAKYLYRLVRHIVKQTSAPREFCERVLALDTFCTDHFVRQYASGTLNELFEVAERLQKAGLIDRVITLPRDQVRAVNIAWFSIDTDATHSVTGVPVTPQLYAFQKALGKYVLQMDVDSIIGRRDPHHDYLGDMIAVLEKHPHVLSVAFQVFHNEANCFQQYFGWEKGGFVPEVRNCLFKKERFLSLRPLPNEVVNGSWKYTWYRAVEQLQKQTRFVSIRGGDHRTYFIHPQNYRKEEAYVWFNMIDKVEQNMVPMCQDSHEDAMGFFSEWMLPHRSEDFIVILVLPPDTVMQDALHSFLAIIAQTYPIGIIVLDHTNNDAIYGACMDLAARSSKANSVSYFRNYSRCPQMQHLFLSIRYCCLQPQAYILPLESPIYLVDKHAIERLHEQLLAYEADAAICKRMDLGDEEELGYFRINLLQPRDCKANLVAGVPVFTKQLFDAIDMFELKCKQQLLNHTPNFKELSKNYAWINDHHSMVLSAIVIDKASAPMRYDQALCVNDQKMIDRTKVQVLATVLMKQDHQNRPVDSQKRKKFIPNCSKLEIDITYKCNRRCLACNRSCSQAPSDELIPLSDMLKYILEWEKLGKQWKLINILGGEPTLHPDFLEIVETVLRYVDRYSPLTTVQITSNGTAAAQKVLSKLPSHPCLVINSHSFKGDYQKALIPYFTPFNDAPLDHEKLRNEDFSKGCWVTAYCGIGLTPAGYYACAVAGAVDRIVGAGLGIHSFAEITPQLLTHQLEAMCQYCGNFSFYAANRGNFIPRAEKPPLLHPIISKTWQQLYAAYTHRRAEAHIDFPEK